VHRIVNTLASAREEWQAERSLRLWAAPNPSRSRSGVELWIQPPLRGKVRVHIYDAAGRAVRTLAARPALGDALRWDGRAQNGAPCAAGTYLIETRTENGVRARGKLTLRP
jgi:hypothetical protein